MENPAIAPDLSSDPLAFSDEARVQSILKSIRADIQSGYHVIPFVGAGFSASSGFPLIHQLQNRDIPYWILRALDLAGPELPKWDVRSGLWPNLADELTLLSESRIPKIAQIGARLRGKNLLHVARERIEQCLVRIGGDCESKRAVLVEAVNVLDRKPTPDWRRMIEFLARLQHSEGDRFPRLGTVADAVIDSLFVHLSRRREPALSHRMLHALASVLRIRVVLTTNFDTLVEQAFALAGLALEVFEVPRTAPLPDAGLVLANTALVKLHGGRLGLRADASVDLPADAQDIKNFLTYLAGYPKGGLPGAGNEDRVALLCSGMSAQDRRTQSLLLAALSHFPHLRIYWVTYADSERPSVFRNLEARVPWVRHPEHGLFLQQLYFELTQTISPSGIIFPGQWQLPFPPIIPRPKGSADLVKTFDRHLARIRFEVEDVKARPCAIVSDFGNRGAVSCASWLTRDREFLSKHRVIWLDLDNIGRPVGILVRLMLTLGRLEGENDPQCYLNTEEIDGIITQAGEVARLRGAVAPLRRALVRSYSRSGRPVIVILNGSECPGSDSPFRLGVAQEKPKEETERPTPGWDKLHAVRGIFEVLAMLNGDGDCGVSFVLLLRAVRAREVREVAEPDGIRGNLLRAVQQTRGLSGPDPNRTWHIRRIFGRASSYDPCRVAQSAVTWAGQSALAGEDPKSLGVESVVRFRPRPSVGQDPADRRARRAFLRLLTLFRVTRDPAGLTRVMRAWLLERGTSTKTRALVGQVETWLDDLESRMVLRRKPGGYIWINSTCRAEIERLLDAVAPANSEGEMQTTVDLHLHVARWYGRVLLGSTDPLAAIEGVRHTLEAASLTIARVLAMRSKGPSLLESIRNVEAQLEHSRSLLDTARGLFECRLSSQFACRSLEVIIHHAARKLTLLASEAPGHLRGVQKGLARLYLDAWRERSRVALREGDYRGCQPRTEQFLCESGSLGFPVDTRKDLLTTKSHLEMDEALSHVHLRQFRRAAEKLAACWLRFDGPRKLVPTRIDVTQDVLPGLGGQVAREWLATRDPQPDERLMMVRLARWWLYALLTRRQILDLASRVGRRDEPGFDGHLHWALCYFDFAATVLRAISQTSDGRVHEENVRLRAHAALCRGILETRMGWDSEPMGPQWAETMLTDAEAFIEEFPMRDNGRNLLLIQLRRAELAIMKAGSVRWFRRVRASLRRLGGNGRGRAVGVESAMRLATAIHDALRWLDRAETHLRQQPKVRWWWWIYIVLRTKACEYLYVLQSVAPLFSVRTRLPESQHGPLRLIPVTVSRFMDSELLIHTEEKQLTDLFFAARIVNSYAQALAAKLGSLIRAESRRSGAESSGPNPIQRMKETLRRRALNLQRLLRLGDSVSKAAPRREIEPAVLEYWKASRLVAKRVLGSVQRSARKSRELEMIPRPRRRHRRERVGR